MLAKQIAVYPHIKLELTNFSHTMKRKFTCMNCGWDTGWTTPGYAWYIPNYAWDKPEESWMFGAFHRHMRIPMQTRPFKAMKKHRTEAHKYHKILLIGDKYGEIINEWGDVPAVFRGPHTWSDSLAPLAS